MSSTMSPAFTTCVFDMGDHDTRLLTVAVEPPKPLLIASPCETGEYPVLLFLHGYLLYNRFYSQLIRHVASHGFVVVAPQLYTIACLDCTLEINSAAELTIWLMEGLPPLLPPNVRPNLSKLVISGHSRGGKAAFALALGKCSSKSLPFSALIGIDPVDGMDKGCRTSPAILTYVPGSFDIGMPTMVVGSGLGEVRMNLLFPPCAPRGVNHEDFFRECRAPACYLVAKGYGHMDMLDDETDGMRGKATYCFCKNGDRREPMRRFVGGAVVAFLRAYLGGDDRDMAAIREGCAEVPLEIQKAEFLP
ncbi:hypothetical protein MLD38_037730 [Melastoma candidum]|uniref:Uncharacterized protein n=1 Tax=Melastoma candidum TaxID=119954 RepID=A0ACB9LNK1_9MYRT|nr:hypothetical protein MLD38_037730 [Melastoma candidum]